MKAFQTALPLALAALAVGCNRQEGGLSAELSSPVATVQVQTVERKERAATEEIVGTVRARARVSVEAKISGRITQLPLAVGDAVKRGQMLVALDAREMETRLAQTQAALEQAERDLKRFSALIQQEAVTRAEFDAVEARHRMARAARDEAEAMLSHATVNAPFDGVVVRKLAEAGDLAVPGKPLLEIDDTASLRFEASVPEALIQHVTIGQALSVRIAARPEEVAARVSEIAPAADPVSRTFLVKLDLPPSPAWRAGQFGRVALHVGEGASLRAPLGAVVRRGQLEFVHVVSDGRARLRLVKTGRLYGEETEIVSGLESGESIVVEGAAGLRDGQAVKTR